MNTTLALAPVAALFTLLGSLAAGDGAPVSKGAAVTTSTAVEAAATQSAARLATAPADPPPGPLALASGDAGEPSAPTDLRLATRPGLGASTRLTLSRRGYLVYLRDERSAAAGRDAASMTVDSGGQATSLVWETTRLDNLETSRGRILLGGEGRPDAVATLAAPPVVTAIQAGRRHRCEAYPDGHGGFAVLCLVRREGDHVAAANATDADLSAGVWVVSGGSTVVRFDLSGERPLESRIVGYLDGAGKAVVVRAESSRVAGEGAAELSLSATERAQPRPPPRWSIAPHWLPMRRPPFERDPSF